MSENPTKYQTAIQVENYRDNSWKKSESEVHELNKEIIKAQRYLGLMLHYQEQFEMEMNFSKNPLLFFGDSQKARRRADVYKAKSLKFRKWFNILISDISLWEPSSFSVLYSGR